MGVLYMKDYILRGSAANASLRAFASTTKELVEHARKIHNLSPAATVALGKTLIATSIMSCFGKGDKDTLTMQIRGSGPIGGIVAVGSNGVVRGYVHNPIVESVFNSNGKLDIGAVVGKSGHLNIIRDIGMKEPYIGFIKLASGEIAQDLSQYFAYSEQIPTVVSLGVLLDRDKTCVQEAGGYLIQLMPGTDPKIIDFLEEKIKNTPSVTTMLMDGMTPEDILQSLLGELELTIHQKFEAEYKCNCSRERMESNLIILGKKEIKDIIDDTGEAELQCHFCNTTYKFDIVELNEILKITEL